MTIELAKPAEWHDERRKGLGGSDANILMNGDPAATHQLWLVKTGRAAPEDLSAVLPVQLGIYTEPFNSLWFQQVTGRLVSDRNVAVVNLEPSFMRCNLDGRTVTDEGHSAIWEAKHVNAFGDINDVIQKYMPQLHHNMACDGLEWAVLSVIQGTLKYEIAEVPLDWIYLARLIDRERAFWACVEGDTPPPGFEPVAPPKAPTKFREVDFAGNNLWAACAGDWLANRRAAKTFETATKDLKALVELDVGRAYGHGIEIKRSKAGALSVREI